MRRLQGKGRMGTGYLAEKHTAQRLNGRLTPASGAMAGSKGDITVGASLLMENKSTVTQTLRLELDWLAKIYREAAAVGKHPALAVNFTTENGEPVRFGNWVMIPETLFKELLEKID